MFVLDDQLLLSAGDLVGFLECAHLSHLDLEVAGGTCARVDGRPGTAELLARKGDEHEAAWLASLRADGREIVEIARPHGGMAGLRERVDETVAAMRAGAEVVFQAALLDGRWRGYADFLERVDRPSPHLGDWSYEVVDTKLARSTKAYHFVQLALYSEMVARIQGVAPERMHVVLGASARQLPRRRLLRLRGASAPALRGLAGRGLPRRDRWRRPHPHPGASGHEYRCSGRPVPP